LRIPDALPDLRAKSYTRFSPAPGVEAERVAYATAYSMRIPAIVYRGAGATIAQHPAMVVVNGHEGDKSSWYAYWTGILYARAGAIVLTYDPIGEYERNDERRSNTSEHDRILEPEEAMATRLSGLMIADVLQSVTYLSSRPDVDPKRIAVLGYSMGSFVSAIACALDTRIHACVLSGGGDLDGLGGYWDRSDPMCQGIPYRSLSFLEDRGAMLLALNAKRGPTLIYNGSADEIVDIPHHDAAWFEDLRKRTAQKLGTSKNVFDFAFAKGGGHRPYFVSRPVALWLQEKLKFPEWTKKAIESMPETPISVWAHDRGVTGGALSTRHEGGTLALGQNIPAVPRADLFAVPEVVWTADRDLYVYSSWVQRARSDLSNTHP
jgi:dienelactone hydrolase